VKDENGRDLIPLTAAEVRRLFSLHTLAIRPPGFHERWSAWRRRQAQHAGHTTPDAFAAVEASGVV
jgi:hypothetical protein